MLNDECWMKSPAPVKYSRAKAHLFVCFTHSYPRAKARGNESSRRATTTTVKPLRGFSPIIGFSSFEFFWNSAFAIWYFRIYLRLLSVFICGKLLDIRLTRVQFFLNSKFNIHHSSLLKAKRPTQLQIARPSWISLPGNMIQIINLFVPDAARDKPHRIP